MADAALSDFNPSARADARRDSRYAAVLQQVQKLTWPAGQPMVPGGWAETLAIQVLAAVRRQEGKHRLITHHTYEGPGPCNARFYGVNTCGFPRDEHELVDDEPAQANESSRSLQAGGPLMVGGFPMLTLPLEPTLAIHGPGGQPLVTLNLATGEMTYGPGYTPDVAAEAFWDAVDVMGLAPVRQEHVARAAKDRAWALVGEWRRQAAERGEDPYADPYAQALAAALVGEQPATDPAGG
ncbi:hypothetical protein ACH4TP_37670 [Streptomyces sp. NPDC021012]|uniref:hypothetical protein n=1 Tax=Streptomyces sp. NPDC021012 TaxID=3365107 RepID=UPI0037AC8350